MNQSQHQSQDQGQSQSQGQGQPGISTPGGAMIDGPGGIRLRVLHETHYRYASPVALSRQFLHLTPRQFATQRVAAHRLDIDPEPSERSITHDYFGNQVCSAVVSTPHRQLGLIAESLIELRPRDLGAVGAHRSAWELARDSLRAGADPGTALATRFLFESPHIVLDAEVAGYASRSFTPQRPLIEALLDLNARIHTDFEFDPAATTVTTPLSDVLRHRHGVCQDFAHLMAGCLRSQGLAARYVSGYILTAPPPGMPRLIGSDASHAWASVFVPGLDWVDFDPTNNCLVDIEHVTLAWGRDFSDVTPTRGVILGGGEQDLSVQVTVSPEA